MLKDPKQRRSQFTYNPHSGGKIYKPKGACALMHIYESPPQHATPNLARAPPQLGL